jgi:hypothetical protein
MWLLGIFCIGAVAVLTIWVSERPGLLTRWGAHVDYRMCLVAIAAMAAAAGHSLSVPNFRWTYDNNPFIYYVFATVIVLSGFCAPPPANMAEPRNTLRDVAVLGCCLVVLSFSDLRDQVRVLREASVLWHEVRHLQGVFMRPHAAGMRRVVDEVREAAPDASSDAVLLLPEDPNVQSWFERRRPKLTSAIIFVDQYWDLDVDEDFRRLSLHPPKVIVIGPRTFWRSFFHDWHRNWGAERLIDLVQSTLIPRSYRLLASVPISLADGTEHMDIYVRRD